LYLSGLLAIPRKVTTSRIFLSPFVANLRAVRK
jgi:hypothetical protein